MSKTLVHRFSPVSLLIGLNALLALSYLALIATVMSYAALHIEFAGEVRSDEAAVATLESAYLNHVSTITSTDYSTLGYVKPASILYVPGAPQTALNTR